MVGGIQEGQKRLDPHSRMTFSVKQAVEYSGLSRSFLYNLFASGDLKRLKAGKRVLILKSDMDAYLSSIRETGS